LPARKRKVIIVYIPKKKRTTYHHGDLRNALIRAALEGIAEAGGPEGFNLRDAARRAGVSPAAPYRHFADREELLGAVAGHVMEQLGAAMDAAIAGAAGRDPLEVFRATGIAYVTFAVTHPAHFRVMNMPSVLAKMPPETHAKVEEAYAATRASLSAAQAAGVVSDLPLDDILLAAHCVVHGLAHRILDGLDPALSSLSADAAAALAVRLTEVLGIGLVPRR
jgi:AcrR family transcriptional regulator